MENMDHNAHSVYLMYYHPDYGGEIVEEKLSK